MRHLHNQKIKFIREYYNNFLESIPARINMLKILTNKDIFTYEFGEIDEIEDFYRKYVNNSSSINLDKEEFENIVASYFGTAFRWYVGGNWELDDDKRTGTYGCPFVDYYDEQSDIGNIFFPFNITYTIETNQSNEKTSAHYERMSKYLLRKQETIQGYKVKPIRDIN